jgi:hypothetical protein
MKQENIIMVKYATSGFPSLIRLTRESCLCTCERGGLQREREIRKKERKKEREILIRIINIKIQRLRKKEAS